MTTKTIVELVDDLDGSHAAETVQFSLDGVIYEIDLSKPNAKLMRSTLAEFVEKARRVDDRKITTRTTTGRGTDRNSKGRPQGRLTPELAQQIRKWAATQGIPVKPLGRLADDVIHAYYSR